MPTYKFVVLANPTDGEEADFNAFYSDQHIPDVLAVPGIKTAQRFVLTEAQRQTAPSPFKYMAIYEVETDDLAALCAEIGRRSGTEVMPTNPYIQQNPKFAYFFMPMEEMRHAGA